MQQKEDQAAGEVDVQRDLGSLNDEPQEASNDQGEPEKKAGIENIYPFGN